MSFKLLGKSKQSEIRLLEAINSLEREAGKWKDLDLSLKQRIEKSEMSKYIELAKKVVNRENI